MGAIGSILKILFGGGQNVIAQTAAAFIPNAENSAVRQAAIQNSASKEFASEFYQRKGFFDRLIDGINRLPRPTLALGTIGLFVFAMVDPLAFAARMQGLALVPDKMWWLLGAIVTFYFGARYQAKAIEAQKIVTLSPKVVSNIRSIEKVSANAGNDAETTLSVTDPKENAAISEWRNKK